MISKICKSCSMEKLIEEFYVYKKENRWHHSCKTCVKLLQSNYHKQNRDEILKNRSIYYHNNKEKFQKDSKIYREKNKNILKQKQQAAYFKRKNKPIPIPVIPLREVAAGTHKICPQCNQLKTIEIFGKHGYCKPCQSIVHKQYRKENLEECKQREKKYYYNNIEKIRARKKRYIQSEHGKAVDKAYKKRVYVKLAHWCRTSVRRCVISCKTTKKQPSLKYLGCTIQELREHIENQFTEGMSWDKLINTSEIVLDHHYVPVCWVNPKREEELYIVQYYKNIKPMWEKDNAAKGALDKLLKFDPEHPENRIIPKKIFEWDLSHLL